MMHAPLALYVHYPFCVSKCAYCDFNSIVASSCLRTEYMQAIEAEASYYAQDARLANRSISSIFIGGGTPSVATGADLDTLLQLRRHFKVRDNAEWSIEANPGTIDMQAGTAMLRAGVNRISLGVQSLDNRLLKRIGRSHTAEEAVAAVSCVREAGFVNLNLDLIFGLPDQSIDDYRRTLQQALELRPEHFSLYGLQVEEGTPFYEQDGEGLLNVPSESDTVDMYYLGREMLQQAGYRQYEISNFALPGYECQHNLVYWRHQEYIGLGAGAASYVGGVRFTHESIPAAYVRHWQNAVAPSVEEQELITPDLELGEALMLGFRLSEGISISSFNARFGIDFLQVYGETTEKLLAEGLIERSGDRLFLSEHGWILANRVCSAFLPDLS